MTFDQHPQWCKKCGAVGCRCSLCHGIGWLSAPGPMGQTIRCSCMPAERPEPTPAAPGPRWWGR